jgi:hypothetical protein
MVQRRGASGVPLIEAGGVGSADAGEGFVGDEEGVRAGMRILNDGRGVSFNRISI